MDNAKLEKMTTQPVPKLINELALPSIVSMLVTSIYNMADTFWVAKINKSATAAVGVVFAIMALIQAVGFFCGHGSGNYMSRTLGANKVDDAKKMAVTGFTVSLIFGLCLMTLGLTFLTPLAKILGSTDTMLPYSRAYMQWILIGSPIMMASLVMNNQLRFQGNSFFAMIGISAGGILNIVLDPLFIFGLDLGIAGAAIATILSQAVSFCLLLWGIFKSDSLSYDFRCIHINRYYLQEMLKGGFPSLCRQGISSVSTVVLNLCAGPFGDAAIAGISIVTRFTQFCFSFVIGFGQGFQPVCGFNYGAKKYDRVKQGFWYVVKVGTAFALLVSVIAFIFAGQILTFFQSNEPQVIAIGTVALRFQCITLSMTVFLTATNMMLQVVGKTVEASILALCRQGIIMIPCVLILSQLLGLLGIQMTQMVADLISLSISIVLALRFFKEMDDESKVNV